MLSKAVVRAARLIGLAQRDVAAALGISRPTSRMFAGKYLLSRERAKEWELAVLLVRLFRSLDAPGAMRRPRVPGSRRDLALGGRPADLVRTVEGTVRVVAYLDTARGRL